MTSSEPTSRRKLLVVSLAVAVALCVGGAFAVAGQVGDTGDTFSPSASVDTAAAVSDRIEANLGVFRVDARSDAPELSPASRAAFTRAMVPDSGANVALARSSTTSAGPVFVVPGVGQICQVSPAGMGCGDDDKLGVDPRAYALFGSSLHHPKGTLAVSGIASDDVQEIHVVLVDGSRRSISIDDNVYGDFIPVTAKRVVYEISAGGSLSLDVPQAPSPPDS